MPFGMAQVSTEVSGVINSDITWTKTSGPYTFVGPVSLSNGATLTIQPGASILLGQYNLLINGTLRAQGTLANPIRFQGGANGIDSKGSLIYPITFTPFSTAWNQQTNTGCIIENAVLQSTSVYIGSSPKISFSTLNYSFILIMNSTLNAEPQPVPASPTISNNTFNGAGDPLAIATFSSIGLIANNTISGYTTGIEIHSDRGTKIQTNLITNNINGIQLIGQQTLVVANIQNNTITGNNVGISLQKLPGVSMVPTIQFNNIYANSVCNINSTVPDPLNASNNWWGTTNAGTINQTIFDSKQNSTYGTVTFIPFLTAPNTAAPSAPTTTPQPTTSPINTPTVTNTPSQTYTPNPSSTSTSTPTTTGNTPNPTSSSTTQPTSSSPLPSESPSTTQSPKSSPGGTSTQGLSKEVVYGIVIAVAVVIVVALALVLRRKKPQTPKNLDKIYALFFFKL
jgi:hypothetical protein